MASKRRQRVLAAVAAVTSVAVLGTAVLAVEVVMARNGPQLENTVGVPQDGTVPPAPGTGPLDGLVWADGGGPVPGAAGAAERPVRVAWLGDSTTTGVGASGPDGALPRQVAARLGRPVELTVLGRSGARLDDVVAEQVPKLLALPAEDQPELIIVSVGSNDVTHLTRNNAFRSAYIGLLDQLPESASVITLGVPDLGSVPRFAQPLRWVAGWRGGTLDWDVEQMRDLGADYVNIADFTGPAFGADPDRYFAADRFHPSDEGYRLWAETVAPVARWRLYKREHPTDPEPLQPKEAKGTVKGSAP